MTFNTAVYFRYRYTAHHYRRQTFVEHVLATSVSVKRRHSVFDAQNFGQNAQKKKDSASSDAKDFPVDAQFHMAVRQVDEVIA